MKRRIALMAAADGIAASPEIAANGTVTLTFVAGAPARTAPRNLSVAAYGAQMKNAAYRDKLKSWLRVSPGAATQSRDGLFSGCSGRPALPQILGEGLIGVLVTSKDQSAALGDQMHRSPALALLITDPDTPAGRIDTGRRLRRSPAATGQGHAKAHVNRALEYPRNRAEVAGICDVTSGRPSRPLRLGRGATPMPYSLRSPPAQNLITSR